MDEFLDIIGWEETSAAVGFACPPVCVRLGDDLDDVVFVECQVLWFLQRVGRALESVHVCTRVTGRSRADVGQN